MQLVFKEIYIKLHQIAISTSEFIIVHVNAVGTAGSFVRSFVSTQPALIVLII